MVFMIEELDTPSPDTPSPDTPSPETSPPRRPPLIVFKGQRRRRRWAIIGVSVALGAIVVAVLLCVVLYYALPPIEICVMECPTNMTPDPECLMCMPQCPDPQEAKWGKVRDSQTLLPLGTAFIQIDVTKQEVMSSNNGGFSLCAESPNITFQATNYILKQMAMESGYMEVYLEKVVPLQMTVHPLGRTVLVADSVILCCEVDGNPDPDTIQWYKDEQPLRYFTSSNISIENVTEKDAGLYWCRASNQYSAVTSSIAEIVVVENETTICHPDPRPKMYQLQSRCTVLRTGSSAIDVGECPRARCVSPPEGGATCSAYDYDAQGQGQCCEPIRVEVVTERVHCELQQPRDVKFKIVRECGCRACSDNLVVISGYVTSDTSDTGLEYVDVMHNKRVVALTDKRGYYMFSLSHYTLADRRVVLMFDDPSSKHLAITKSVQISGATHFALDVQLPKPDRTMMFNSTEGGEFFLGNSSSLATATVQLAPNSLYDTEGYEYNDEVEVTVKWIEPSEDLTPTFLPSDLMAIGAGGDVNGLSSFGMFAIQFRSPNGQVLTTSDGIQVSVNSDAIYEPDPESNTESDSKLWVLNPDTGFWEFASDLRTDGHRRSKRQTETVYVGRVRISAERLWINIDKPFPMCLVKVRAFSTDEFNEDEQVSDVKVTVVAMNPPKIAGEEWRWGRIGHSVTHERQGACVTTICDVVGGSNWGYIKASRAGQPLYPADPEKNHSTGLKQYADVLEYETTDDAIKTKLAHINSPPFYFYAQYLLCYRERFNDPHFRFYVGSKERCRFEHTVLPEPELYLTPNSVDFNYLAWYPRANPEHFYEVCYIKLAIGASFVEKGPDFSQYDEVKRALVHGGGPTVVVLESTVGNVLGNVTVHSGDSFGSRSQCAGPDKTVCLEFKKTGVTIDKETIIETELQSYVELSRCGLKYNEAIMNDFPSVGNDRRMPIRMVGSKYGVYCEKGAVLPDVKTDALRHCYAGSDVHTSVVMLPGVGIAAEFCPNWCEPLPCQNNGKCTNWENGYHCTCSAPYRGKHCQCKEGELC